MRQPRKACFDGLLTEQAEDFDANIAGESQAYS